MKTLIKNLEKELVKSIIKSEKLELKYNASKNEKNEYDGCRNIYKQLKNSWELNNILDTALTQLKKTI